MGGKPTISRGNEAIIRAVRPFPSVMCDDHGNDYSSRLDLGCTSRAQSLHFDLLFMSIEVENETTAA
uniref:Uncharacterized protein n=1 Tax=Strigamia maritima TaxID=126957 RepID=T1IWM5_STRMM